MTTNEIARDITRRRPLYVVKPLASGFDCYGFSIIDIKTGLDVDQWYPTKPFLLQVAHELNGPDSKTIGVWRSMQALQQREFSKTWETGLLSWLGIHRRFRFAWSSTVIGEYVGRTRQIGWLTWWSYRHA